ncbi:MAG: PaaI family thioesterase [Deltaproteobacteria bacterium]|nr:PaaI family thioesterase [Deltaproteobacteria bacterium]
MISESEKKAILDRISRIPIFGTLDMRVVSLSEGACEVTIPRRLEYDGIYRSLHGGILVTLADSVAAFAILTLTGPDEPVTTTDLNIRYLAPCLTDLTARARVIKLGRTLCPVAVDLLDAEGKLVAVSQVTYLRLNHGNKTSG